MPSIDSQVALTEYKEGGEHVKKAKKKKGKKNSKKTKAKKKKNTQKQQQPQLLQGTSFIDLD